MNSVFQNAFLGSLVGDALAMPVHWYYNVNALDHDYPNLTGYMAPRNPHPDSILWRSSYKPLNDRADLLRDQALFWGRKGVHYHQFLEAGENTLNYQLAIELYRWIILSGQYDPDAWLKRYIDVMLSPGWHRDTYVEEVHRNFFTQYARGRKPGKCAVADLHIGAVSQVPALLAAMDALGEPEAGDIAQAAASHVALTHDHPESIMAAKLLAELLSALAGGQSLRDAIANRAGRWVGVRELQEWEGRPDREVLGDQLSTACYLPESMTASLYLAWKYERDFGGGIIANATVGGDNCHRAAVVASLLGGANGVSNKWLADLQAMESLRCDQPIGVPDFL